MKYSAPLALSDAFLFCRFSPSFSFLYQQQVGDNLFVHAGLLPEHIRGAAAGEAGGGGQGDSVAAAEEVMERLNADTCAWMLGKRSIPEEIWQPEGPLWTRVYSTPDSREIDAVARAQLEEVRDRWGTGSLVRLQRCHPLSRRIGTDG